MVRCPKSFPPATSDRHHITPTQHVIGEEATHCLIQVLLPVVFYVFNIIIII